jgi:hypothetical protein
MEGVFETIGALVCPAAVTASNPVAPTQGTIIVSKHVINDNTGLKQASDFTMLVTATNPSQSSFPGVDPLSGGVAVTVDPGSYDIDEALVSGYSKTRVGCTGTIAAGETKSCTITNNDLPPGLPPPPPPPPNIQIGSWEEI